jgi:4-oxalocrotonate tautomerase
MRWSPKRAGYRGGSFGFATTRKSEKLQREEKIDATDSGSYDRGRVFASTEERDYRETDGSHGFVEGENMRGVTWVTIEEVKSGDWGIGGKALTTNAVKALAAGKSAA